MIPTLVNHMTHLVKGSRKLLIEDTSDELYSYRAFLGLYQLGNLFLCTPLCDAAIKAFDANNMVRAQDIQEMWLDGACESSDFLGPTFIETFLSYAHG